MEHASQSVKSVDAWINSFQAVDVHSDEGNIVITQGGQRVEIPAELAARLVRAIELAAIEEI